MRKARCQEWEGAICLFEENENKDSATDVATQEANYKLLQVTRLSDSSLRFDFDYLKGLRPYSS
jgi:hypothetical protein